MDVGAKLEAARKACGYTREYVAKIINTSQQNIYKYEKGIVSNIPVKRIEALCSLYGISVVDVLGWERSPEEEAPAPERDERERGSVAARFFINASGDSPRIAAPTAFIITPAKPFPPPSMDNNGFIRQPPLIQPQAPVFHS